jgi:6-phosphofructokinase 2
MQFPEITTFTPNPTVDLAAEAERVEPTRKTRTFAERHDPGGGGVNVARVLAEFGATSRAILLAGGVTGRFLEELLSEAGIVHRIVPIAGRTRISLTVHDRNAGLEYRFVPEGPEVVEPEVAATLAALAADQAGWLVLSGSLPRGFPAAALAEAARTAAAAGRQVVLDTSGEALRETLGPHLLLAKPSLSEFEALTGGKLRNPRALAAAALRCVREGGPQCLVVSLGPEGALLATRDGTLRMKPPPVKVLGAVGAGDTFVAAMTLSLALGERPEEAFAWGLAAGAAAVSQPGTAHPRRTDISALRRAIGEVPSLQPG